MADTTNIVVTNKPNALDYYNAGVNTYNAYTNQKTLETTRALYDEFAKITALEEHKQKREELLAQLRQFVFEREAILERIMPFAATAPIPAYIATVIVQKSFGYVGIDPSAFPEFVDKDRIKKVLQFVSDIASNAQEAFSIGQDRDAHRCLGYLDTQAALTGIIDLANEKDAYKQVRDRISEINAELNKGPVTWLDRSERLLRFLFFGGLALLVLGFFVKKPSVVHEALLFLGFGAIGLLVLLGVVLVVVSVSAVAAALLIPQKAKKVAELRTLQKHPAPDEARFQQLSRQYAPDMSLADVIRLKTEHEDYIAQCMFYDNKGKPLPADLIKNLKDIL